MSSQYWPKISSCLEEIENERQLIDHQEVEQMQIGMLKSKASKILEELKILFDKRLTPNQSSLIQFALISHIDEEMQSFVHKQINVSWPPLQQDFGAHNAGEIFFKNCDDILEDRQTPPIVYEVYYFIIKRGFKGRYKDAKTQIYKYLELLQERISNTKIQQTKSEEHPPQQKPLKFKPKHYYIFATALSIFFLLFLFFQSSLS